MSDLRDKMERLSAAEEFFTFLDVPYDPAVVQVNRLHILKRFHDYIGELPSDLDPADVRLAFADALARAYQDFVDSDAVTQKVFKVFQQAEAARKANFVPLGAVARKRG